MAYNAYADYVIFFSDVAEYEFARSFVPEHTSLRINPVDAAALFSIAFPAPGGPIGTKGFIFVYPYQPNNNINHPAPSGVLLDPSVDFVTVPGQTTSISPTPGDTMLLYWSASVVFRGPEYTTADPGLIAAIPPRRWAFGAEGFGGMEFHANSGTGNRARDSSRVVDGIGVKFRSDTSANVTATLANSEGTGLPTKQSWERFYIRIRNLGANIFEDLWRATGSVSTNSGARIYINPDGTLTAFNVSTFGVNNNTFGTSAPLDVDVWYRIDVIVTFTDNVLNGTMRVYINGVLEISGFMGAGSSGLGENQNHGATTILGMSNPNVWELDFDDWHNAQIPNILGVETLNSIDWLIGTHIKSSFIISGTSTNWTGLLLGMNQYRNPAGSGMSLVATVALSTIRGLTDIIDYGEAETQDASGVAIGPACASFSLTGSQSGGAGNNGRVGYNIAGGADVLVAQGLGAGVAEVNRSYLPSGSITPYPIEPVEVIYEKGNTANAATILAMLACVQYVGLWGPEDGVENNDPGLTFNRLMHNCRYPYLGWTIMGPAPDAPVCVVGGTYVGNGTFQSINLVLPCHLLIIRNVTVAVPPVIVTTTTLAAQQAAVNAAVAGDIPILGADPITGQAFFTVVGSGNRVNQSANTYQFTAFCDPGLRYMLNGEFNHGNSALNWVNPLIDTAFTPEFGIFSATVAAPGGIWLKGPRHIAQEVSTLNGALVTTGVEFATGAINTGTGISEGTNATAYTLMRTLDGSALTMIQITSYTGDGTASRIITMNPLSGRFPLMVLITRRGGSAIAIYRDASHAGVNSMTISNAGNINNGITLGGVDSITVGIGANVNGAEYDVLCIPGSGSGWLNGTFCGPNGAPPGTFWEPDPEPLPPGVAIMGEGGLIMGDANPLTLLKNISGIYTLTPGKKNDTMYDRQTGQTSIDMEIPDPTAKTGYIGG